MEEEKKEEQDNPSSASEEKSEDQSQNQDDGQKPDNQDKGAGEADQSAELEKSVEDLNVKLQKLTTQNEQAGHVIQGLKEKLKDNGIDIETEGISEERVKEIIQESTAPLAEELKKSDIAVVELARALSGKGNANSGGAGQKTPLKPKEPVLPAEAQGKIKRMGLEWVGKGFIYKSPTTGRIYDLEDDTDIA